MLNKEEKKKACVPLTGRAQEGGPRADVSPNCCPNSEEGGESLGIAQVPPRAKKMVSGGLGRPVDQCGWRANPVYEVLTGFGDFI